MTFLSKDYDHVLSVMGSLLLAIIQSVSYGIGTNGRNSTQKWSLFVHPFYHVHSLLESIACVLTQFCLIYYNFFILHFDLSESSDDIFLLPN